MDAKTQQDIKKYTKNRTFLCVEPTVAGKTAMETMLQKTAVQRKNVKFAKTIKDAIELIKVHRPQYIITHENLEDGNYKELLELHVKNHVNRIESGFILLSENDSVDQLAKISETPIDSVVLLPFTVTSLQNELLKVIIPKSNPNKYEIHIEEARDFIRYDLDKAFDALAKAKKNSKKPFEAFFLEGNVHLRERRLDDAKSCFEEALKINPTHYGSLKELFNIYMLQKDKVKAYKISSRMNEHYPVNPEMIPDLAWVSVACAQYDDILKYRTAFKNVESPDTDMKNYIAASMTIYGKKIVKDKFEENKEVDQDLLNRAFELMEEASLVCEDKPLVYASLVSALKTSGNKQLMEKVMDKARSKFPQNKNIQVLDIITSDVTLTPAQSLQNAQKALKEGIGSPEIHEIVLKRSLELGLSDHVVEEALEQANSAYPNLQDTFQNIYNSHKK